MKTITVQFNSPLWPRFYDVIKYEGDDEPSYCDREVTMSDGSKRMVRFVNTGERDHCDRVFMFANWL